VGGFKGSKWYHHQLDKIRSKRDTWNMPLWKRTSRCPECGLVMDCDEKSAVTIRTRYLAQRGPHTSSECGVLQDDGLDVASMELAQAVCVQKSTV